MQFLGSQPDRKEVGRKGIIQGGVVFLILVSRGHDFRAMIILLQFSALIVNANRDLLMAAGSANPAETLRCGCKYIYSTGFGSN